jgi:hypothetical protein
VTTARLMDSRATRGPVMSEGARKVAQQLRAGNVALNGVPNDRGAPFGGYKRSGNGRAWGRLGLEESLELRQSRVALPPSCKLTHFRPEAGALLSRAPSCLVTRCSEPEHETFLQAQQQVDLKRRMRW